MSISFFDTWNEAENYAGQAFDELIPGGHHCNNLLAPISSGDALQTFLAPLYGPFAFNAYTLLSFIICTFALVARLICYAVKGIALLAKAEDLDNKCNVFLMTSQRYALLNAYLTLMFLSLILVSSPYATVSLITRTTATIINHLSPPVETTDDEAIRLAPN